MSAIGVIKEAGERRVALTPEVAGGLVARGWQVLVERGAGAAAWFADGAYGEAGAGIVAAADLDASADVVVSVGRPPAERLRRGCLAVGMLGPVAGDLYLEELARRDVTAASLDRVPRTLSAAQPMDALTSQENVAGYRAAVLAASLYGRFFPLLVTAAGTAAPARVLVLGAGVAGLQAIGTARRLGAVVTGYDIRPEARQEVASLGAAFLELPGVAEAAGTGGYARAMDERERQAQQEELAAQVARFDVVICTARVPGHAPPLLVTEEAVKSMRPGSVVLDLADGNVETTRPGERVLTPGGVTVVGAGDLAGTMPSAASTAYAHNVAAYLGHLFRDGEPAVDLADEITAATVVVHEGRILA